MLYLKKKKHSRGVVLVGNGPSATSREMGKVIDTFDIVVRCNNFTISNPYNISVGSKCDILVRRTDFRVYLWPKTMFSEFISFVTFNNRYKSAYKFSKILKRIYGRKLNIVNHERCKEVGEKLDLDQPKNEWPSIGILALDYLVERYGFVTIYGFDHLIKNKENEVDHYYPLKSSGSKFHNPVKERFYTEKLIKEGKVIRL